MIYVPFSALVQYTDYRGVILMMCPNELVTSITALAVAIAEEKSEEEISLLAALFTQLGDTLATIAVQKNRCSK